MVWNDEESRLASSGWRPILLLSIVSELHVLLANPSDSRSGSDEGESVRSETINVFDAGHSSSNEDSTLPARRDHAVRDAWPCPYHGICRSFGGVHFTKLGLQGQCPC